MGSLHELLAVEPSTESASTKLVAETTQTFKNKEALFKGKDRTLVLFGKTDENQVEFDALEAKDRVHIPLAATVPDNLNYTGSVFADYLDVVLRKELSNQTARGDVIINGVTLATGLPATFLLGMETKLKAIREMINEIPTMTPAVDWVLAPEVAPYVYKAKEVAKDVKTAKVTDHKMLPQPNQNIAVQYVPIETTINIGQFTDMVYTGLINTADKAKLIERLDTLLRAIKQARQRANAVEIVEAKVGDAFMGYLFGSWFDRNKVNTGARV